jgi:formate C-acetyltransferase
VEYPPFDVVVAGGGMAGIAAAVAAIPDTPRVLDLRRRVRDAMERPPAQWECPARIDPLDPAEPVAVRKARAIALKLSAMPADLWEGQLLAGSMTLEEPRAHAEHGFPAYVTDAERDEGRKRGLDTGCFGHIVPDYPTLLAKGLGGIRADAEAQRPHAASPAERAFLDSVCIALDGVTAYAGRLANHCAARARTAAPGRAAELRQMEANLRRVPAGPAGTFWQALQSVWLLHMIFHSTRNGNAVGRLDQYAWPLLEADLAAGRLDPERAAELVACFCLKFNERAKTTDDQRPEARPEEKIDPARRTRHYTSSQIGTKRDGLDATNHWLQNIVIGGLTPAGADGTNPLTHLLLEAYRRNEMTNPLVTVRLHRNTPDPLLEHACAVLKAGGGMPALFNDEQLVPALERIGIPTPDARDYTNDGCWEIILPGRTNFCFQRLSLAQCLEWALRRVRPRMHGGAEGPDTGDPRAFASFEDVFGAWARQLDHMVGWSVERVMRTIDDRSILAPVPLLSALIDGCIRARRDMTAGGAKFRTYALLAESAAHAIDSLVAVRSVVFEDRAATMAELCDALEADFRGHEALRRRLLAAPKYGNDAPRADTLGRRVIDTFTATVARHAAGREARMKFPCGVGTFSWYVGIGEGLGASPDGRRAGEPVSSNFSPALGRDTHGLPGAVLSYARMHAFNLPAGGPLDLRLARRLVPGPEGTRRMAGFLRGFVESGGSMMTLTVVDTEELRAAQREPGKHRSLRVRMGGWSAYFTMLSREQQEHHIRRQEAQA